MSLDISNIVASRICHDIISPIGAIHNGLELISMTASLDVKSRNGADPRQLSGCARALNFSAWPLAPIKRAR